MPLSLSVIVPDFGVFTEVDITSLTASTSGNTVIKIVAVAMLVELELLKVYVVDTVPLKLGLGTNVNSPVDAVIVMVPSLAAVGLTT